LWIQAVLDGAVLMENQTQKIQIGWKYSTWRLPKHGIAENHFGGHSKAGSFSFPEVATRFFAVAVAHGCMKSLFFT